jgi:FIMAH domain
MNARLFAAYCRNVMIVAFLLFSPLGTIGAQVTPALATVNVQVTVGKLGSFYIYNYTVFNDSASQAGISRVMVDVTVPPQGASLSGAGLNNGQGFLESIAAQVFAGPKTPQMVPLALSAPALWLCGPAVNGTVQWFASDSNAQISPSRSLSGYQITSPGLPGIRTITLERLVDVDDLDIDSPQDDSPAQVSAYLAKVDQIRNAASYHAMTVAPTAPPAVLKPVDFLQTIISYKALASQLGWIASFGIANSFDAKLSAAQAALGRGDNTAARNQLDALFHEVDAQAGKQISPEAVALLKFNTQYLISKIP